MTTQKNGKLKMGIAGKIAVTCSAVVLFFLFISNYTFLKLETNLVSTIVDQNKAANEKSIEEEGESQLKALEKRMEVNTDICATIASSFLYNIDPDGLKISLRPYMGLAEVLAIEVKDYTDQPFFAFWRDSGVQSGTKIPESIAMDHALSASQESIYNNEKVGSITLYVTDQVVLDRLAQNRETSQLQVAEFRKTIDNNLNRIMFIQIIVVVIVILILIATIVITVKRIATRPIKGIVDRFKDMAEGEGDLTVRLEVKNNDEMGELAQWFNTFILKIQGIIADVAKNSSQLNTSSKELATISNLLSSGADQASTKTMAVAEASEQMSAIVSNASTVTQKATDNLSIVASAAEEMTATINEIAKNTETGRHIAGEAVGQTSHASEQIEALGNAAQEIGKVVETITNISEQVNLLALNATIEAARAGEAGKGFTVVANEIKELAQQTASASGQIKDRVEGIQRSTQNTIDEIADITKVVVRVSEIVTTIAASVEEQSITTKDIADNVARVSQWVSEVNSNVAEGSQAATAIATDITEVTHSAGEISNSSAQVNSSSAALSQLAEKLDHLVGQFKI